jgi:putative Ca2+/H+ antiporter (TMEM165/GDT1 family)
VEPSAAWLFVTVYSLIFIAELPDKTAFASVILAARLPALPVFLGGCAAFLVHTVLAVAFGSAIGMLPGRAVHIGAGVLFLSFGIMMWRRGEKDADPAENRSTPTFWATFGSSFVMIFIAEWGDLTQLAIATMSARYQSPAIVFSASLLALWSVTAIGVCLGARLKNVINLAWCEKIAAIAFLLVGLWLVGEACWH